MSKKFIEKIVLLFGILCSKEGVRHSLKHRSGKNGGKLKSDGDGRSLNMPKKNVKGQKADMNQARGRS